MLFPKSLVKTTLFTAAMALGISACNWNDEAREPTYTEDKVYKLTVLYTSSFPDNSSLTHTKKVRNAKMELINELRKESENNGSHLILISGGSTLPEQPSELDTFLSAMEYDALVVTGYMFNQPLSYIRQLEQDSSIPFISANLFESETGQPLFDAFTLVSSDDLNIAILGITSTGIKEQYRRHLSGLEIVSTTGARSTRFVERLKEQSDIMIAATHSGHRPGDSLAGKLASFSSIDLVIGEHEEEERRHPSEGCDEWVTKVDLEFINGKTKIINREYLNVLDLSSLTLNN